MTTFCGRANFSTVPSYTSVELNAIYPNSFLPATMPAMTDGMASASEISAQIKALKTSGRIPAVPQPPYPTNLGGSPNDNDPLRDFSIKETAMKNAIKGEYCHYEGRYLAVFNDLLNEITRSNPVQSQINSKLNQTIGFNKKLMYLTQITDAIAEDRLSESKSLRSNIDNTLMSLKDTQQKLLEQRNLLSSENAAVDLHKRMVEYTTEKARANSNLLSLYFVLNMSALAMIYYVART